MANYNPNGFYKKQTMKFEQLNPDSLAGLYANRPSRKRVIIDEFLEELETMRDSFIEEAVEKSKFKDANAVIAHIKSKL